MNRLLIVSCAVFATLNATQIYAAEKERAEHTHLIELRTLAAAAAAPAVHASLAEAPAQEALQMPKSLGEQLLEYLHHNIPLKPKIRRYDLSVKTPAHYRAQKFKDHQNFFPRIRPNEEYEIATQTPLYYQSKICAHKYFIPRISSETAQPLHAPVPKGYRRILMHGKAYFLPDIDFSESFSPDTQTPQGYTAMMAPHKRFEATL